MSEGAPIDLTAVNLRGLAHPVRLQLLTALRERGPSTATRLAASTGQSSGLVSYHLRQLAAYGFVEDEPDRGVGRERWWRAAHAGMTLAANAGRQALPEAEGYLRAVAITDFQRLDAFLSELSDAPGWDDAWTMRSVRLRLTPARAADLRRRIEALIDEYPRDEPGAEQADDSGCVTVQWQVFPDLGEGA